MVSKDGTLRASEFAATLNGDNHQAILNVLKLFARTVRREREVALALDDSSVDDNDDDWSNDEMEDADADDGAEPSTNEPPTKKYKKSEEWKADTAAYHVPFVGTAVARGERSEVIKGVWPTGLVKAYLESSPLAIELLNDDLAPHGQIYKELLRKKKSKLYRAICKAHQLAIAELLTVAIPKHKLQEADANDSEEQVTASDDNVRFLQGFTKGYLPRLFDILNEETERGRGKPGTVGGCDSLVAPALKVLKHYTMTSISGARLVAKHLDESIVDGVLRVCLRPLHMNKESQTSNKRTTLSKQSRTEAILLATSLLQANDAGVNTYICTGGSKERKVKPGILFLALREGLSAPSQTSTGTKFQDDKYNNAVIDMLEYLRGILFSGSKVTYARLLFNLMSRDPLQHLCRLSSHAPPLTKHSTFIQVLDAKDNEDAELDTVFEDVGVEARRLLFPLLSDAVKSPFLPNFGTDQVARSMVRLLESKKGGIELRRFLLYCTKQNPSLIEELFGLLTLPDAKNSFAFMSQASFITLLLSKGPSPISCLSAKFGKRQLSVEDILPTLLPMKLKGQFFAKSLQNGNHLVRVECFKMVLIILNRFESLRGKGVKEYQWDKNFVERLKSALFQRLPDLQILLSLRSRFEGMLSSKCGAILSDYLFRVIQTYVTFSPSLVETENFDWMKLLPGDAVKFNRVLPILQVRILKCLQTIIIHCQRSLDHLLLSSKILFEIMLSTKSERIHTMCRKIIMTLMTTALVPRVTNDNSEEWIEEEVSTWIDAVSPSTISPMFKLLQKILNDSWSQLAFLGKAWKMYHVPKTMNFTALLAGAFSNTHDSSQSFDLLVGQVAARCLTSLRDPLPLAALINYSKSQKTCVTQNEFFTPLVNYAQAILNFSGEDHEPRISLSTCLMKTYFNNNSFYPHTCDLLTGTKFIDTLRTQDGRGIVNLSPTDVLSFVKFLNHTFIFVGNHKSTNARYWHTIQQILADVILHRSTKSVERKMSSILSDLYAIERKMPNPKFDDLDMLILSCPFLGCNDFVQTRKLALVDALYNSRNSILSSFNGRSQLLRICLVKNNLPPESTEKIQLSLITETRNAFSDVCLQFLLCCFRIEAQRFHESYTLDFNILETALNAWVWVAIEAKEQGKALQRRIKGTLCSMLTHSLLKEGVEAACLMALIDEVPESILMDLCLDFSVEEEELVLVEIGLLSNLLRIDPWRFLEPLLGCLRSMGQRFLNVWNAGHLDHSMGLLLEEIQSSPEMLKLFSEVVFPSVSRRLIEALSGMEKTSLDDITSLLHLVCKIFETGNTASFNVDSIAIEVIRIFSLFPKTPSTLFSCQGTRNVCFLGFHILSHFDNADERCESLSKEMMSVLFNFLFGSLAKILKKNISHAPTEIPSDLILSWLIRLVKDSKNHGNRLLKGVDPSNSHKACRACLKHGIAIGNDAEKVALLSLQFVGLLLRTEANEENCASASVPSPKEVFSMVVSHSKFDELFTDVENNEEDRIGSKAKLKEAILRLMIACNLISIDDIEINPSTWKVVFASFGAGVRSLDIFIRQLASVCSEDSAPLMNNIRWKGCSDVDQERKLTRKFDWFVDALNATRIDATISNFPMFDRIDLDISLDGVWAEKPYHKQVEDTSMETDQTLNELFMLNRRHNLVDKSRKYGTAGAVEPYSPAFVLPLMLKTIETGLSPNNTIYSENIENQKAKDGEEKQESILPWNFSRSSIECMQQLCQKGAVSLCLASLSSFCDKIRCYAVSILGLILQACHTSYALESSSWRDRPQLVMILNSIQRALLLQKAGDEGNSVVPRLTPIISSFLARAALVLPKPDDPLYVSMNRHFLKTENEHGAFQDMKRLPAFMSLFCSSSEDPNQSRAERMWGLQMLSNGVVDASCYRLLTSCHAPELVLSSFENIRLSQASCEAKGAETCSIFESLKSMIDNGGYGAHVHLIRRCGLLSWMSSICTSRSLTEAFPTERSRVSFCHLANSLLETVFCNPQLRSSELIDEIAGLIQPLVSLSLLQCHSGQSSSDALKASLLALRALSIGLRHVTDYGVPFPGVLPLGASVDSSIRILRMADDSMKALSLHTLCSLPVSLTTNLEKETALDLILLLLQNFEAISSDVASPSTIGNPDHLIALLLQRIALLIDKCETALSVANPIVQEIATKLFTLRCNSKISHESVRALRSRCLGLLMEKDIVGSNVGFLEGIIRKEISSGMASKHN